MNPDDQRRVEDCLHPPQHQSSAGPLSQGCSLWRGLWS
ncbi:hypothetical protein [Pseudomonas huanghezhanensis]